MSDIAIHDLNAADEAVDQARSDLRQAGVNVQTARAALATALTAWHQSAPAMTALQIAREFQAQSQAARQARAEAGLYRRPATVGETAKAYAGGGMNARRGGGRAYARGALSKAQALEVNARRTAAEAAAAKLLPQHE